MSARRADTCASPSNTLPPPLCEGAWSTGQGHGCITQFLLDAPSHSLCLLTLYLQFNFPSPSSGSEPFTHTGSPPKTSVGERESLFAPRPLRGESRMYLQQCQTCCCTERAPLQGQQWPESNRSCLRRSRAARVRGSSLNRFQQIQDRFALPLTPALSLKGRGSVGVAISCPSLITLHSSRSGRTE
jgi:hypothetical protein